MIQTQQNVINLIIVHFRVFWIVVFIVSVYIMVTVFRASYKAYEENSISFVTETTYLDWNTSFPAITLCPIAGSEPEWDK